MGGIYVSSSPSGATVYLNNVQKGKTPIQISGLKLGSYTILLKKTDYEDYKTTANVQLGMTVPVNANLIEATRVTSPWNGEIVIVKLSQTDINAIQSETFGPGPKTYSIVDNKIDKFLHDQKIVSDLKTKGLTPEKYFDTKSTILWQALWPNNYRDRIARDTWLHGNLFSERCIQNWGCFAVDDSPGTIGFDSWFVTSRFSNFLD